MATERKVAKRDEAILVKGIQARREQRQPYAAETEDYASPAVKTPQGDPRRKSLDETHSDTEDRLRPLKGG